jgi:hypothetical protein
MRSMFFASLLAATACSSEAAYADQVNGPQQPGPRVALAIAGPKVRAPYDVQIIRENGETLPTYAFKDRFYVQGNAGERYIIRVTNPTPNRIEAVVSVDGLDVVDGDEGDLHKRGYIVPPNGDVRIEGFRTSLDDVATFRFSSVDGSYAGKKGKARNVGVIAVALFEEQAPPPEQQIIMGDNRPAPQRNRPYDYNDDIDASVTRGAKGADKDMARADRPAPAAKKASPPRTAAAETTAAAPPPPPAAAPQGGYGGGAGRAAPAHAQRRMEMDEGGEAEEQAPAQPTNRMGLGTEFGEQRNSSATYTRFVRAPGHPVAIAELRYNDSSGLTALGIMVQPLPDVGEIMTRETADPFPGDRHFSNKP